MFNVSDEKIIEAFEGYRGLNIYHAEIPEEKKEDYNYFYYIEDGIIPGNVKYLTQELIIFYVSKNQSEYGESEIIDKIESIGLNFVRADYDRLQLGETNQFIDVIAFRCTRKMKRVKCNGYRI
ncbi:hypothetical protein SAMN05444401_3545 [Clostridium amylolyticum]|uniref:Uncharacterized protein n=1 Tax=Clostridium amylolyticum TaxID=1121298 RepID=A0A1M6KYP7_9CLOT|nr:hypothetical protein [Clostridium amylolyticum]SHJ64123.1 hypothetical protein SAMN05444401_3545 [Clostridium amylolyticum]